MSNARKFFVMFALALLSTPFWISKISAEATRGEKMAVFGKTSDGQNVDIYTLTNSNGLEARIMTYGGTVVSIKVPDRNGKLGDVVLGYDDFDGYLKNNPYLGAIAGRYANRIGRAKFSLDGREYSLPKNDGDNTLHGGVVSFGKVVWLGQEAAGRGGTGVTLRYLSKNGEEGFPGDLTITVMYTLTDKNELRIDYAASTDKPTVVNLTNHCYFNLAGKGSILNHELMINADRFTPVGPGLIPTGELRSVKGTPLDFTAPTTIGARIDEPYDQLKIAKGYDHNWVLNGGGGKLELAAKVHDPATGRVMEVYTTEPGLQFYTGNFLDGSIKGKSGEVYERRDGFCLETQHFPDSPNKPDFPSTVLRPGHTYRSTTIFKFSVK
ncbi:MAG TPA: aldose epimerase family protein [Blastocatellia bacterium]|nr:aldose epimerase family protein [Blastocatellia bacterium]